MDQTKVLYVEDEPFLGKIVKESLESRDFQVEMVADGALVLDAFQDFRPDICVLDVMLPNKDGFTLGQELRQLNANIPIIFLTAKNQTGDVLQGFESGGNDYIKKPFSMEELIARIDNLLSMAKNNQGEPPSRDKISIGKYIFYPQKYELTFNKQIRKLSHREAQLLNVFTQYSNQAVERKLILKEVWGDDSFFNSRNLDVYVTKLRDYLKEDPNVKIITLKGIGYRFLVE